VGRFPRGEKDCFPQSELPTESHEVTEIPAHVCPQRLFAHGWKPHGILDQELVNEIGVVEAAEERAQKPFNRFADLSALEAVDLNSGSSFTSRCTAASAFESHPPSQDGVSTHESDTAHYPKLHAID